MLELVEHIAAAGGVTICDLVQMGQGNGKHNLWTWALAKFSDAQWVHLLTILDRTLDWNRATCAWNSTALISALREFRKWPGSRERQDQRASMIVARSVGSLNTVCDSHYTAITYALFHGAGATMSALVRQLPLVSLEPQKLQARSRGTNPPEFAFSFATVRNAASAMEYVERSSMAGYTESLLAAGHAFLHAYPQYVAQVLQTSSLPPPLADIIFQCIYNMPMPKSHPQTI
jgi:hypothetical protein